MDVERSFHPFERLVIDCAPAERRRGEVELAGGREMAESDEAWVQLATRVPKRLHREVKLFCVRRDVRLMTFVVGAIREKLGRESRGDRGRK